MDPSRSNFRLAARQLGELVADLGDFYDIAEEIAIGWATAVRNGGPLAPSAAYTTPGQMPAGAEVAVEANFAADQGAAALPSAAHIFSQLCALNELRSVAGNLIQWRVDDARERGMSWQDIGDALEISRQAAQQRYGKVPTKIQDQPPLL